MSDFLPSSSLDAICAWTMTQILSIGTYALTRRNTKHATRSVKSRALHSCYSALLQPHHLVCVDGRGRDSTDVLGHDDRVQRPASNWLDQEGWPHGMLATGGMLSGDDVARHGRRDLWFHAHGELRQGWEVVARRPAAGRAKRYVPY